MGTIPRGNRNRVLEVVDQHVAFLPLFRLLFPLMFLSMAGFAPDQVKSENPDQVVEPVPCQLCHEVEDCQWKESRHSQAMGMSFMNEWELKDRDETCLECHTDIKDPHSDHISTNGVTCQSCHGPDNPDHPNETKMMTPVNSETCKDCHCVTWGQWQVSGHGQNNIRCFDCHKMHKTEIRKENPDELCGTCHEKQLTEFIKAKHSAGGIHCINCHMPEPVGIESECQGKKARGHSFHVFISTCSDCHSETIHSRSDSQIH